MTNSYPASLTRWSASIRFSRRRCRRVSTWTGVSLGRAAYGQAAGAFLCCCEGRGITSIEDVQPVPAGNDSRRIYLARTIFN
jgi:hypothetical protein